MSNPEEPKVDLDTLRHSCAHLMAQAVKQLYPETQVTIGPVIEDGFYYDFFREEPFHPEDLKKIEKRMQQLAKEKQEVKRIELSREEAVKMFQDMGEPFKVEIIEGIAGDDPISAYSQGEFTDLCRGPHVENTRDIRVFKLLHTSSAYWRGDERNPVLGWRGLRISMDWPDIFYTQIHAILRASASPRSRKAAFTRRWQSSKVPATSST